MEIFQLSMKVIMTWTIQFYIYNILPTISNTMIIELIAFAYKLQRIAPTDIVRYQIDKINETFCKVEEDFD